MPASSIFEQLCMRSGSWAAAKAKGVVHVWQYSAGGCVCRYRRGCGSVQSH